MIREISCPEIWTSIEHDETRAMGLLQQALLTQILLLALAQRIEVTVAAVALVVTLGETCEDAEAGISIWMTEIAMTRETACLIVLTGHEAAHGIQYDGNGILATFGMIEISTDVTAMTGASGLVTIRT